MVIIELKKIIDDIFTRYYDNEKFLKLLDVYTNKDDETINNGTVTIRDRDTMEQITLKIEEIKEYINEKIRF